MKTIGIIAEFNPFHKGHKYLIEQCKKELGADRAVIVMSGDFVQRGAPAIIDKSTRAKMALRSGADLVLELPIYYCTGSAEFFAMGAVRLLDSLGCVDYLCFGSEDPDLKKIHLVADIVNEESASFKETLGDYLKQGDDFATARTKAIYAAIKDATGLEDVSEYKDLVSSPNNILAIEYVKSLKKLHSKMEPYALLRIGQPYHSAGFTGIPSASAIRARLFSCSNITNCEHYKNVLCNMIPEEAACEVLSYQGRLIRSNHFSDLMYYKLIREKSYGYSHYLDVSSDISNLIEKNLENFEDFSDFCETLKSKNMVYTRLSRCFIHILLDITRENMSQYKKDGYTSYIKVLGMRRDSSDLMAMIHEKATLPVIDRPKEAVKVLSDLQLRLFEESMTASQIYNRVSINGISSEYRQRPIII